jgi:VWFA-related protein
MRRAAFASLCLVCCVLAGGAGAIGQKAAPAPQPVPAGSRLSFDMVVVDRDGRVPDVLSPADIAVSVDGKPRRVASVRRVSRGPGAVADAAGRQARAGGNAAFAAEPIRTILLVVDQASLVRGEERTAVSAAQALLDRLGVSDRLAVVLLPFPRDEMLSLATEQPVARETLSRTAGQIDPATLAKADPQATAQVTNPMVADPDRLREAEPMPEPPPAPTFKEADSTSVSGTLSGIAGLVDAIRTVPGRKVIAVVSAGLTDPSPAQLSDLAAAAIAARIAIHVFALPGPRSDATVNLHTAPLEALAKSTGGAYSPAGRNPERVIGRAAAELAACYVVEIDPAATDAGGKRHTLRVEALGRGLTARAPAWLIPSADPGDLPAGAPAPAAGADAAPARDETPSRSAPAPEPPSAKEAELQVAMARLVDYVEAYERQYSGLVAEEEYQQSSRGRNVRLRSDYLLVKPEQSRSWISFRDVYEVDGVAVRDRDDRLRKLFLEPGDNLGYQLQSIRDESARYNVGAVERNINVPLFMLQFLSQENRPRFRFRLSGTRQVEGTDAWRIEFDERARPTIISDIQGRDVVAKGWFLVDELTGAVVETRLSIEENGSTGEIVVSFRRDEALGMWVPARMVETYRAMALRSMNGMPRLESLVDGTAKYSKFRRFQVKIEEKVVIPK